MDIDQTKAPRTYAAWKKSYDVQELAKLMVELSQQLEVELNTAIVNEAFAENKVYMFKKQLKENQERIDQLVLFNNQLSDINVQVSQERDDLNVRIKRLVDAGDVLSHYLREMPYAISDYLAQLDERSLRINNWHKAKEDKL